MNRFRCNQRLVIMREPSGWPPQTSIVSPTCLPFPSCRAFCPSSDLAQKIALSQGASRLAILTVPLVQVRYPFRIFASIEGKKNIQDIISPISTYAGFHGAASSAKASLGTLTSPGLYKYHALRALIAAAVLAALRLGPAASPSLSVPL